MARIYIFNNSLKIYIYNFEDIKIMLLKLKKKKPSSVINAKK